MGRFIFIFCALSWSGMLVHSKDCTWERNESCYSLIDEADLVISQNDANGICFILYGGQLVSITSEEEQNFLAERLLEHFGKTRSTSIWTGGYCDDEHGQWKWASLLVPEKFEFTAWEDGEDHNVCKQPYAILMVYLEPNEGTSNWEWWEEDHDKGHYFLCESKI